jgi:hypothetical protein
MDKGHAKSMNMIYSMISSRYLLYIEDDWMPLTTPVIHPSMLQPLRTYRHKSSISHFDNDDDKSCDDTDSTISLLDIVAAALNVLNKRDGGQACTDFDCLEDLSIVQVCIYHHYYRYHSYYHHHSIFFSQL